MIDLKLVRGHSFLASLITPGGIVIDAGAHRCEFANRLSSEYGVTVISIEPNADLSSDRLEQDVTLLRAALAGKDGEVEFAIDANPEASSIVSRPSSNPARTQFVTARSLSSLVAQFGVDEIDLLKLDIEGAEYEVLMQEPGEVLSCCKQISVEFHPHDARDAEDVSRIRCAADRLRGLGFTELKCSYRGYGDILFVNGMHYDLKIGSLAPYIRKLRERFLG
ncbi:FkbM family methyltransferase [Altererythrobacter sp. GH1-8]|uniref:FkbM family methyltransferase n=1 Tax=Altererythrobacter sp. GH1-8 TaxID=3349333 RepID=UPI00374D6F72